MLVQKSVASQTAMNCKFESLQMVLRTTLTYRPTEMSLEFIRWLRVSLTRPTSLRRAIEQLRPLMLAYL